MEVSEAFLRYLSDAVGEEGAKTVVSALSLPASVSVRMNPSKAGIWNEDKVAAHFGCGAKKVAWSPEGWLLAERPVFTLDPLLHGGAYYVQDSSAMFVGEMFRKAAGQGRDLRVLDLCAAPGGKTTDLAASLRAICGDSFVLVANEVMKQRATVLAENVALWGDPNVVVTSADPKAFASLDGFFDVIVADVPCSGEGMFRKDEEALNQWSEDNVALCEARQRRILADVWSALAEGGILVYSTCTFNRRENDGNVRWIAGTLGAEVMDMGPAPEKVFRTELGYSLLPGMVPGEGQYCAVLRKDGEAGRSEGKAVRTEKCPLLTGEVVMRRAGDLQVAMPEAVAAVAPKLAALRPISMGVAVGTLKGRDMVPDPDLALCLRLAPEAYPAAEVDLQGALAFLHRDNLLLPDAPKGYLKICYEGVPLGFVKNLGNRTNSLMPVHRRIRMDIK